MWFDWYYFPFFFAIACILYGVSRWAGNRFDRWWIKTIEEDDE